MTLKELMHKQDIIHLLDPKDIKDGYLHLKKNQILYRENENELDAYNNRITYHFIVNDSRPHRANVTIKDNKLLDNVHCDCYEFLLYGSCRHLGAILVWNYSLLFTSKKNVLDMVYDNILDKFIEPKKAIIKKEVKVELNIILNDPDEYYRFYQYGLIEPKITIGTNKMYVLGNKLNVFINSLEEEKGEVKFGKEFIFDPEQNYLTKENEKIIFAYHDFLNNNSFYDIKSVKKFLKELENYTFYIDNYKVEGIKKGFPINSELKKIDNNYKLSFKIDNLKLLINKDYEYIFYQGVLYKLSIKEQELLKVILDQNLKELIIKKDNFEKFSQGLFLIVKNNLDIDESVNDVVIPKKIVTEIYFDLRDKLIKANPKFKYDLEEVDYFQNNNHVLRDLDEENKVINELLSYNFILNKDCLELTFLEDQVNFLENGLEQLAQKYVIYTTEKFKNTTIKKKTNINSMFGIGQDNILSYNFNLDGIDSKELVNIFKEIKNKQKYYRLKNGDILSLEDEALQELASLSSDLELTDDEIRAGKGSIMKYRAIYLDSLKAQKYGIIQTDNLFTNFINNFYAYKDAELSLEQDDLKILRDYQLTGVKWLYNLAKTGFGGILADEMGLGKTIQVIYYLKQILLENPLAKFLIVVPTSLAYNWEHEFSLYANDLKRVICVGNKNKREEIINNIDNYNIIVTTYGLLREDEELYQNLSFHTMIIDEAQNIKNNLAAVTKAVKKIKAEVKFALTGTPLENSVLELWSIFDYIMPGYLANLTKFQSKYKINDFNDDTQELIKGLNRQINPFILRRKKIDVIKELPSKLINDIFIDLGDEQKKLYVAELEKVKEEMDKIMATDGISKARFLILKLLTKLRQICIDPSIVYENYNGESNKIETLINIIKEYIQNNHKILIFSSFRTALNIVKNRLEKEHIDTYMIDGSVKSLDRINMVDDFNEKDDVPVFLIMLKSGGTGLNLTRADVVIHLDLWWNPQAENQATDRAHRIGQTKTVEVIHLVTKGTIEEKILELQNKKRLLMDKIIDNEIRDKNIISTLTKEDIQNLLSYENKD